jgi:hypothetical protein
LRVVGLAINFGAHEDESALGIVLDDVRDDAPVGESLVKSFQPFGDGDVVLESIVTRWRGA